MFPIPGLIGRGHRPCCSGYVDYRVVAGVVEASLRKLDTSATADQKAGFESKIRIMRVLFAIMTVGVFPVIGYLLGVTISGG